MKPEYQYQLILLIAALFVITPIFHLTAVIDPALVPRFLCLSVVLILGVFLFFRKISQTTIRKIHLFDICFLIWYLTAACSLLWAFNISEGVFPVQKIFVGLVTYSMLRFLLFGYGYKVLRMILICNFVITLIMMGSIFWGLSGESIPNLLAYTEFRDIKGFSSNRNLFCSFIFLTLIFNILFVRQIKKRPMRIAYFCLIALQIFMLLLLQTRTVYIALAVSGLVFLIGYQKITSFISAKKAIILASVLGIVISLIWARYYFYDDDFWVYFLNFDIRNYVGSASAQSRLKMWEKTALLIQEKPFTGVGAGNWRILFPKNGVTGLFHETKDIFYQRSHNDFLWVFSEIGLVGFLAYIGMFFTAFFVGIKSFINGSKDTQLNLLILLCGLLGYLIIANLSFPLERIEHQIWLMLLFAVLFFHTKKDRQYSFQLPFKIKGFVLLLIALVGLSFNLVVGYHRYHSEKVMRIVQLDNMSNAEQKRLIAQAKSPFMTLDHAGFPLAWREGIIAKNEGNYSKAREYFKEAYQLNPYNHRVLTDLASANGQLKNYDAAKKYLLQAHYINNNNEVAIFNLAVHYYKINNIEEAIKWANKLSDTYPRKQELMKYLGL